MQSVFHTFQKSHAGLLEKSRHFYNINELIHFYTARSKVKTNEKTLSTPNLPGDSQPRTTRTTKHYAEQSPTFLQWTMDHHQLTGQSQTAKRLPSTARTREIQA